MVYLEGLCYVEVDYIQNDSGLLSNGCYKQKHDKRISATIASYVFYAARMFITR